MATKRVSLLNGSNFSQDYDFSQTETALLTEGFGTTSALKILAQAIPDDTVRVSAGVACIEVTRNADAKTFKLWGELNDEINLTVEDTGVNPTWKGAVVVTIDKAAVENGIANPEDGTAVFDIQYVPGLSTSTLTDGEIETAVGTDYYWLRAADVVQDPTVATGDITDRREIFGVTNVNLPNEWALRWRNNADTEYVDVLKLTTGDIAEFQMIPRNRSDRSYGNDYELIDRKYFNDNTITQVQTCTLGETCATEDVITFKSGGYVERWGGAGGSSRQTYGNNWNGQYFVSPVNATHVEGFRMGFGSKTGTPAGNLNVSLYLADGAHKPTGAALATKAITANSWYTGGSMGEFKFAAPVAITGGSEYALVWSVPSGTGANYLTHSYPAGAVSGASGKRMTSADGGATWTVEAVTSFYQVGLFYSGKSNGKAFKADISDPFLHGKIIGNLVAGGDADDSREFNYLTCDLTGALQDDGDFYLSTAGDVLTAVSSVKFGQAVADDQIRFSPKYEHAEYGSFQNFGFTAPGDGDVFFPTPFKVDSFELWCQTADGGGGFHVVGDALEFTVNPYWDGAKSNLFITIDDTSGASSASITAVEVTDHGIWLTFDGTGTTSGPHTYGLRARKG